jgi:hypothetical protein
MVDGYMAIVVPHGQSNCSLQGKEAKVKEEKTESHNLQEHSPSDVPTYLPLDSTF